MLIFQGVLVLSFHKKWTPLRGEVQISHYRCISPDETWHHGFPVVCFLQDLPCLCVWCLQKCNLSSLVFRRYRIDLEMCGGFNANEMQQLTIHQQSPQIIRTTKKHNKPLVGDLNSSEKNARQIGSSPRVGVKIKSIWNFLFLLQERKLNLQTHLPLCYKEPVIIGKCYHYIHQNTWWQNHSKLRYSNSKPSFHFLGYFRQKSSPPKKILKNEEPNHRQHSSHTPGRLTCNSRDLTWSLASLVRARCAKILKFFDFSCVPVSGEKQQELQFLAK